MFALNHLIVVKRTRARACVCAGACARVFAFDVLTLATFRGRALPSKVNTEDFVDESTCIQISVPPARPVARKPVQTPIVHIADVLLVQLVDEQGHPSAYAEGVTSSELKFRPENVIMTS